MKELTELSGDGVKRGSSGIHITRGCELEMRLIQQEKLGNPKLIHSVSIVAAHQHTHTHIMIYAQALFSGKNIGCEAN